MTTTRAAPKTLELDAKGRLAFPEELQEELGIAGGDRLVYIVDDGTLFLSIADPDLQQLREEAWADYKAGKTIKAEELAREFGVSLDDA